jgi:DNA-binding GntR family transcriptional regulator
MFYLSLNKKSSKPYYLQIQESIERAIQSGMLKDNDRLATVLEVASFFDVSVMAPRKAYDELENKGLVYRVKGKGTFIKSRPKLVIPLQSFYDTKYFLKDQDWTIKSYISYIHQQRDELEMKVQTHLNGYPISHHEYRFYVPLDEEKLNWHQGNVIDYIYIESLIAFDIDYFETDFLAKSATAIDAQILNIPIHDPLIRLSSKAFAKDKTLLFTVENYYPSAFIHFESRN